MTRKQLRCAVNRGTSSLEDDTCLHLATCNDEPQAFVVVKKG
jgi:hypothetical protein